MAFPDAVFFAKSREFWYDLQQCMSPGLLFGGTRQFWTRRRRYSEVCMRNNRSQFLALFGFLVCVTLLLSNGFVARIFAQPDSIDVVTKIAPIGDVLDEIMRKYVEEPDADQVVEGALIGMMNALDEHSAYISPEIHKQLTEETEGEFEGIGIHIQQDKHKNIVVFQPIAGSPADKAGLIGGDIIFKIDGESTKGLGLEGAADRIRGPRGTVVELTILRPFDDEEKGAEQFTVSVKRGKIPLWSIVEARVLENGVGYIRLGDFKKRTAQELGEKLKELEPQGMKSLVLDLRWNPGGLLLSSIEVCELFLPRHTLVTYTKGRVDAEGQSAEVLEYLTERAPQCPASFPIVILTNEHTASSSEIVTGALQYWKRALVVGEKTFGKGSVQTIISLKQPKNSALKLTTALYYTPAEVTIHKTGIHPDVEVPMNQEEWMGLLNQMRESYTNDGGRKDNLDHGSVTGGEATDDTVEDIQLQRAVEILTEDLVFENLIEKYHKDTKETQIAAKDQQPEPEKVVE
jgi:carboxyl-terminal processing protease